MFSLLLISGSIIGVMFYRSLRSLLRQIPSRNRDFNAFLPESGIDSVASTSTAHKASQSINV